MFDSYRALSSRESRDDEVRLRIRKSRKLARENRNGLAAEEVLGAELEPNFIAGIRSFAAS